MKAALFALALAACAQPPLQPTTSSGSPGEGALAAGAAAVAAGKQIASPPPDTTALAWKLVIAGGRARFHTCADEQTCGTQIVEIAASDIVATRAVGRVDDADVIRLTLAHPLATSRGGSTADAQRGLYVR